MPPRRRSACRRPRSNERYFDQPLGQLPWDDVAVDLQPRETVAPVGSEVVLMAGVCGPDGYLRTNRRLEWSIDPGSVGQFVAVGEDGLVDLLLGDFNRPRKITNVFAIGSTARSNIRLNRGTCRPEEDVYVLRGQGWITLTSAVEGTSHVTVFAPEVYSWDARLKSADDPLGRRPVAVPAAGDQSGRHRARVHHHGDAAVEPDAVRALAGAVRDRRRAAGRLRARPARRRSKCPPIAAGQASVEIFQKEPKHGTNKICIQVIRPGDLPGANGQRLVVGTGTTMKTWTAADLAVKTIGPAGGMPGRHADLSDRGLATRAICRPRTWWRPTPCPTGLTLPRQQSAGRSGRPATPLAAGRSRRPAAADDRRELPRREAGQHRQLLRSRGRRRTEGERLRHDHRRPCPSLELRMTGPSQAAVGSQVTFEITVTNLSRRPGDRAARSTTASIRAWKIRPPTSSNAIERLLGDLAPGARNSST